MENINRISDNVRYLPKTIIDKSKNKSYATQSFLGKGSYAKCFEVVETSTKQKYACKILSKDILFHRDLRSYMASEIEIHTGLDHINIVKFVHQFCDDYNIYILLELCPFYTLKELQKNRTTVTEYECRYYIFHIMNGIRYLHNHQILHRDLKLGNIFLADNLIVKIGDFGLATRILSLNDHRKNRCGTLNYYAPEVLLGNGYSFEVDIWCMGIIMYMLLVGRAPFKANSAKDLYHKIIQCDYTIPSNLSSDAVFMIQTILQLHFGNRPNIDQCYKIDFIHNYFIPDSLPNSCLRIQPTFENYGTNEDYFTPDTRIRHESVSYLGSYNDRYIGDVEKLYEQLTQVTDVENVNIGEFRPSQNDEAAIKPEFWISKWTYDKKFDYAFSYKLFDGTLGVLFNDGTKFLQNANKTDILSIDKSGYKAYLNKLDDNFAPDLKVKLKLFAHFTTSMERNLMDSSNYKSSSINSKRHRPTLHTWFTTTRAIIMHLTNGTVQINFLDHMKMIFSPHAGSVTFLNASKEMYTIQFTEIISTGLPQNLHSRLTYATSKIKYLLDKLNETIAPFRI